MDLFEEYLQSRPLSENSVLEDIDEYEIYKFYLGFYPELRTGYSSPLREGDDSPSFSLFSNTVGNCEYRWKDSGKGLHGDVFKLVQLIFNLRTREDACAKIRQDINKEDYGITSGKLILKDRPIDKGSTDIAICSKPSFSEDGIKFWSNYGIRLETLELFNVTELEYFRIGEYSIYPKEIAFGYRELDKYQIYQPYNPEYKFRNNYTDKMIIGFHQLKYEQDTLIITKSRKDVMMLYELGYEAVSPRSENTLIPIEYINYFKKRYNKILVLFDNDMKHRGEEYNLPLIYVPLSSRAKDISDFCKLYGKEIGKKLIDSLC